MSAADLQELRRLASQYGLPLDLVDRLGLRPLEIARTLGASERKVREWIETERLPASKIDDMVIVPLVELLRFLEENRYVGGRPEKRTLRERAVEFVEGAS